MGQYSRMARSSAILSSWVEDPELAERLIAAAKAATLDRSADRAGASALVDVACWVAAPFFVGFTYWVRQKAAEMGLERLYFLARDGQLPYRVSERLELDMSGPESRYLFVSRRACSIASLHEATTEDLLWHLGNANRAGPSGMLERLGIASGEARSCFSDRHPGRPVDAASTVELASRMASGVIGAQLLARAEEVRPSVESYLGSVGFLEPGGVGLVDLGGVGSHIRALAELRRDVEGPVVGFLATRAALPAPLVHYQSVWGHVGLRGPKIHTYFSQGEGGSDHPSSEASAMLQAFCAADHGTVLCYRRVGSGYQPVLDEAQRARRRSWDVQTVQESVLRTVEAFKASGPAPQAESLRPAVVALLDEFAAHPTLAEARSWGQHPMEATSTHGTDDSALASRYGWRDVIASVRSRSMPGGWTRWYAGSLRLSRPPVRFFLVALRSLRRWERRLRHLAGTRHEGQRLGPAAAPELSDAPVEAPFPPLHGLRAEARDALRLRSVLRTSEAFRSTWPGQLRPKSRQVTHVFLDVYDTVLTRAVLPPRTVFTLLAQELDRAELTTMPGEEIVTARMKAYRSARDRTGGEPPLETVYEQLRSDLGLSREIADDIREQELEIERRVSRPVQPIIARLSEARQRYGKLTFVSDMYLPAAFIRSLLQEHGLWRTGDELWVSAEAGAEKMSGQLFQLIARTQGLVPGRCLLVGNDAVADGAAPRWMGWQVSPYKLVNATRAESALATSVEDWTGTVGALAGALRLARLDHGSSGNDRQRVLEQACPIIVGYALWVLSVCQRRHTARIVAPTTLLRALVGLYGSGLCGGTTPSLDGPAVGELRPGDVEARWSCSRSSPNQLGESAQMLVLHCGGDRSCPCSPYLPQASMLGARRAVLGSLLEPFAAIDHERPASASSAPPACEAVLRNYIQYLESHSPYLRSLSPPASRAIVSYLDAV